MILFRIFISKRFNHVVCLYWLLKLKCSIVVNFCDWRLGFFMGEYSLCLAECETFPRTTLVCFCVSTSLSFNFLIDSFLILHAFQCKTAWKSRKLLTRNKMFRQDFNFDMSFEFLKLNYKVWNIKNLKRVLLFDIQ